MEKTTPTRLIRNAPPTVGSRISRCYIVWGAVLPALFLNNRHVLGSENHPTIEKGHAHPYLAAKAVDGGEPFVLDMYRGKKVIMLHLAAWDSDGIAQLPAWARFARECDGGSTVIVGIIHDQNIARAALFAKWKKIAFPTYHDPLNQADARRMGRAVCVDEFGIVRVIVHDPAELSESFVGKQFKADRAVVRPPFCEVPNYKITARQAEEGRRCIEYIEHGDACMFDPEPVLIAEAIKAYEKALQDQPEDPAAAFRLGTAYFTRFQSEGRQADDLRKAMDAWSFAAGRDPKNQVFCERLLQFACTSDKRVNSCGWIAEALRETGLTSLLPAPSSIEIAAPSGNFKPNDATPPAPPELPAHPSVWVIDSGVVRAPTPKVRGLVNVIIALTPGHAGVDAGTPVQLWITPPDGVKLSQRRIEGLAPKNGTLLLSVAAQLPDGPADAMHALKCVAVVAIQGSPTRCDFEVSIPAKLPDLCKS
ncbi:MAG: hypothetical protein H6819_02945 [Phycisphaerales bacterium]|nr:hypothetical protein [Phycisphaerales bacterium]MCB9856154.1 hypothetical protein [Phycisphaerales bacterium]